MPTNRTCHPNRAAESEEGMTKIFGENPGHSKRSRFGLEEKEKSRFCLHWKKADAKDSERRYPSTSTYKKGPGTNDVCKEVGGGYQNPNQKERQESKADQSGEGVQNPQSFN